MTLRQLHQYITNAINENDEKGNGKNDIQVFIEIRRGERKKTHYYEIQYIGWEKKMFLDGEKNEFTSLITDEETLMIPKFPPKNLD